MELDKCTKYLKVFTFAVITNNLIILTTLLRLSINISIIKHVFSVNQSFKYQKQLYVLVYPILTKNGSQCAFFVCYRIFNIYLLHHRCVLGVKFFCMFFSQLFFNQINQVTNTLLILCWIDLLKKLWIK